MSVVNDYNMIPYELSGSMSKNRFLQEMRWGISKMFDLFDEPAFCVVFDYKCDIEVHLQDSLEFYQVKTHKVANPYPFSTIARRGKNGAPSIIGKLCLLKCAVKGTTKVKIAIVSNAILAVGKTEYSESEELCFSNLKKESKEIVSNALKNEIQTTDIDLESIYYIYAPMDLHNPEDAVKGKMIASFEKARGCEPIKPNALYRLIFDTVKAKACYEFPIAEYDDLIQKKGITKADLDDMLDQHVEHTDSSIGDTRYFIEELKASVSEKKKLKKSLVSLLEDYSRSKELRRWESEIATFLTKKDHINELPETTEEIADMLVAQFAEIFTAIYTKAYIYVFCVFIIKRWEAGMYD